MRKMSLTLHITAVKLIYSEYNILYACSKIQAASFVLKDFHYHFKEFLLIVTIIILPSLPSFLAFLIEHLIIIIFLLVLLKLLVDSLQPLLLCERVCIIHLFTLPRAAAKRLVFIQIVPSLTLCNTSNYYDCTNKKYTDI